MLFQHGFHSFIKVLELPSTGHCKGGGGGGVGGYFCPMGRVGEGPGEEGLKCNKNRRFHKKKSYKIVDI